MFTVYLDESGSHEESNAFVVGGYIATDEQWHELAREWRELLDGEGVRLMHMTDLENLLGEFRGWGKAKQIRFITRVHGIIHRRVRVGVSSGVIKSHYDEIKGTLGGTYGRSYYTLCAVDCMRHVANWALKYPDCGPINYVFEQGDPGLAGLSDILKQMKADEQEAAGQVTIGEWAFEDKRAAIQLQAADIVAYETWKQMQNRIVAGELRPMRKSLWNLLRLSRGTPHISNYFDRDNLAELAAIVQSHVGA